MMHRRRGLRLQNVVVRRQPSTPHYNHSRSSEHCELRGHEATRRTPRANELEIGMMQLLVPQKICVCTAALLADDVSASICTQQTAELLRKSPWSTHASGVDPESAVLEAELQRKLLFGEL